MTVIFTSLVLLNAFSFAFIFNATSEKLELYILSCWCCWYIIAQTQQEKTHSKLFLLKELSVELRDLVRAFQWTSSNVLLKMKEKTYSSAGLQKIPSQEQAN